MNFDRASGGTSSAEKEVRRQLDAQGLELPYRRPRAAISRRAVLRALAELLDSGRISGADFNIILQVVRVCDVELLLAEPEARPDEVPSAQGSDSFSRRDSAWLEGTTEACAHAAREIQGFRVVAEHSVVARLNWGVPIERPRGK